MQEEVPAWGLSGWSLHVLPVPAQVLSGFPDFLPRSKSMTVSVSGLSKLPFGISVCTDVDCVSLRSPAVDWMDLLPLSNASLMRFTSLWEPGTLKIPSWWRPATHTLTLKSIFTEAEGLDRHVPKLRAVPPTHDPIIHSSFSLSVCVLYQKN